MAVNMLWRHGEGLSGYLVLVDFPGIHEFVDSARKAGDFWAGSWLISEVMWRVAERVIDELGPDTLLSPTTRMNPYFYLKYLRRAFSRDVYEEVEKRYKEFLRRVVREVPDELELQPLIPGTLLFVLPEGILDWTQNAESVVKHFEKLYREEWRRLVNELLEELNKREGVVAKVFSKVLASLKHIVERPPVGIRVTVVSLREVYEKLHRCLSQRDVKACEELGLKHEFIDEVSKSLEGVSPARMAEMLAFHVAVAQLSARATPRAIPIPAPFWEVRDDEIAPLFEVVVGRREAGWDPCSLCGLEPAVLSLRKVFKRGEYGVSYPDYDDDDIEKLASAIQLSEDERGELRKGLQPYIKPGEALGPYCLLKRSVYVAKGPSFISTDDVILNYYIKVKLSLLRRELGTRFVEEAINAVVEELAKEAERLGRPLTGEDRERVRHALLYVLKSRPRDIDAALSELWRAGIELDIGRFCAILSAALAKLLKGRARDVVKRLLASHLAEEGDRELISEIIESVRDEVLIEALRRLEAPAPYYAVFYADGDDVGKLHRGALPMTCAEYSKKLLNSLRRSAGKVSKELEESFYRICRILVSMHGDARRIMVSPTYKVALSAAIMLSALKDIVAVRRELYGMVVFSGGDDLIALIPVETVERVGIIRRNYEGEDFFHKMGDAPLTSAIPFGRSMSVRIAGLFDIMSEEISEAVRAMEEQAKETCWEEGQCRWKKDTLVITSSRSTAAVHLFLKHGYREALRLMELLRSLLTLGVLSRSLPYDFDSRYVAALDALVRKREALMITMRHVLRRNMRLRRELIEKCVEALLSRLEQYRVTRITKRCRRIPLPYEVISWIKLVRW